MKIRRLHDKAGAKDATGLTIIIDIYRAASVVAYALGAGAKHVIPVATKEEAFGLKKINPSYLLMGEEEGMRIPGFDFGNSPEEVYAAPVKNRILVQRTTRGTQGLVLANHADPIIFGSFPVASAIVSYILKNQPDVVSIVAMDEGDTEDEIYASYLEQRILGKNIETEKIIKILSEHKNSQNYTKRELQFVLDVDKFNFFPMAERPGQVIVLKRSGTR